MKILNLEGIKIKYGDVAPEAKENFAMTANDNSDIESFINLEQLNQYNLNVPFYGVPFEYYNIPLNGTAQPFPKNPQNEVMGVWTSLMSGTDGKLRKTIGNESIPKSFFLTMAATSAYTSKGFTITFDTDNNIFCNSLNIKLYNDNELKLSRDFTPNSAFYFCDMQVTKEDGTLEEIYYDKVIIEFISMCLPHTRLRIKAIDFGYGTYFFGDELQSVSVSQAIDAMATDFPIGTANFTVNSKSDIIYSFQTRQPLSIYFNDMLRATTFITEAKRTAYKTWQVESEDYIGQMDNITVLGDVYTNKNVTELLTSLFSQAKIPVEIDTAFSETTVTGYIPVCPMRDAVRQICFAIGAVADTSNSDKVKIRQLSAVIKDNIPKTRIRQGQSFTDTEKISHMTLEVYSYVALPTTDENAEIEDLYVDEDGSKTGSGILVTFSEPHYNLTISDGTIIESGANYARINAQKYCRLRGYKYKISSSVISKYNPDVSSTERQTVKEFSGATLVNETNAETILNRLFEYYKKSKSVSLTINEGYKLDTTNLYGSSKYGTIKYGDKNVNVYTFDSIINVGDTISCETEFLGTLTGTIISENYNCNGKILVKECEMV